MNLKYEGVYFFGGKGANGFPNNHVRLLKVGSIPLQWVNIETFGTPPSPRYSHSMSYSEDQNILVIFGGRCDFATKKNKH